MGEEVGIGWWHVKVFWVKEGLFIYDSKKVILYVIWLVLIQKYRDTDTEDSGQTTRLGCSQFLKTMFMVLIVYI